MSREIVRSDEVIGVNVEDPEGNDLGEVKGLMLDKLEGTVEYVVLSYGGFLGMGDKLFALPWHIFNYNPERGKYVINVDETVLKKSPGFDPNNWPGTHEQDFYKSVDKYYNDYR